MCCSLSGSGPLIDLAFAYTQHVSQWARRALQNSVNACTLEMKKLKSRLRQWEKIYNTVGPHHALGYLTPHQFLRKISSPQ
jgi:transposase InsO family protein